MRYLLPQLPRSPAHRVLNTAMFCDVEPSAAATLRAIKLLQPLIAEHQHREGLDHKEGRFVGHAPETQLLWRQQVQKILFSIALDPLFRVDWAE